MNVFYTASFTGKNKYQKYYDMVLRAIQSTGVDVVSPELGNYLDLLSESFKKRFTSNNQKLHYEAIRQGITRADAVVIEISNEDFQLGHEATLAIQNKKYVLCLSIHEDFSQKIKNPYFIGAKYNEFDVEGIVANFIKLSSGEKYSTRFNLLLKPSQLKYLEKAAVKEGVNVSEYVRLLIELDRSGRED
ncbi:hypothetical protein KC614_04040 [candidate division WWE3 bacterium]|uniref:Nucleoside 2-deoxyribosyltransferase n=1 Tax=candidate division WWE3 bacterium TaxID=2053526 RepID=A0A955LKU4_UNCKA|nr:hypothetical protein [candidate division WWE3 bacterium]